MKVGVVNDGALSDDKKLVRRFSWEKREGSSVGRGRG